MRDVAAAAGVSLKTVSRVVNGEAGVSPKLEEQVRAAVEELGYQPDDRARYLRRGSERTRSLGFVQLDVTNPFFAAIYRGLDDAAQAEGYLVLAGSSDADLEREQALIRTFIARRVDGLVIASGRPDHTLLSPELARGTPVVFIDQEPGIDGVDVVRTDHYLGGRLATEHLLAHRHRRIAFLGDDPQFFSADERRRAFTDVLAEVDIPARQVITGLTSPELAASAVHRLLGEPEPPTALFTAQNFVTVGALSALHQLGRRRDVAIVGFDDIDVAELVDPAITVVAQEPGVLGTLAAECLFSRLGGNLAEPPHRLVLPPKLIVRGSGELLPPDTAG